MGQVRLVPATSFNTDIPIQTSRTENAPKLLDIASQHNAHKSALINKFTLKPYKKRSPIPPLCPLDQLLLHLRALPIQKLLDRPLRPLMFLLILQCLERGQVPSARIFERWDGELRELGLVCECAGRGRVGFELGSRGRGHRRRSRGSVRGRLWYE